jgi:AcrR family transcriptional regulator
VTAAKETIRDVQRRVARTEIADRALTLFLDRGYEATTVDDVATATGLSVRTVFRYISSKEEMVIGALNDRGNEIADDLASTPQTISPRAALVAAVEVFARGIETGGTRSKDRSRLLATTPQLRGALAEKRQKWQEAITPRLVERLDGDDSTSAIRAEAMVASVLACLDVAVAHWAFDEGQHDLIHLFRATIDAASASSHA